MIFVQVEIENFFAIKGPVVWNLKNQGLVLISGENGAGKSSLFEALLWCLWGKTMRGYSGDAVVNRTVKRDCRVQVRVEHEGETFVVTRYRKHRKKTNCLDFGTAADVLSLTQGTATLTQAKIEQFLGIDYGTFVQGPMMPQGSFKKFSEMGDAEQKVVLESALQIGVLAAALDVTKDRLAEARQKLSGAQQDLRGQWLHYEGLQNTKASYERERDSWARKKRKALTAIANEMMNEVFEQENYWAYSQTVDFEAAMEEAQQRANKIREAQQELAQNSSSEAADMQQQVAEATAEMKQASREVVRLRGEADKLKKLGGECPTCKQEIDGDHIESCVSVINADIVEATNRAEDWRTRLEEMRNRLDEYKERRDELAVKFAEEATKANDRMLHVVSAGEQAKRWLDDFASSRNREVAIRQRFRDKQQEECPFHELIQNTERKLLAMMEQIVKTKARVRGLLLNIEYLEFWKTGFSNQGVKSYILDSVTPFLNERANYYAQILTGGDIQIEFSTQTFLKNGEAREKFAVLVTNRRGAETYAGNSGGEKSRADLAINYTLSDLISSRARRPFPQRFLDEPFESLDEAGIESVMELLSDMSSTSGSIFVVTHQDAMKGLFNKQLRVEKTKEGTQVTRC